MRDPSDATERGAAVLISYRELVDIKTQLVTITAALQAALALQGTVDKLDKRVSTIELLLAGRSGEKRTWNTILGIGLGWFTAAIGAGALSVLPKLWGG